MRIDSVRGVHIGRKETSEYRSISSRDEMVRCVFDLSWPLLSNAGKTNFILRGMIRG